MRKNLPALVTTFETIYEDSGDAEAYGLSKLLCTYKFVASLYMLCDILHTVAKLHGSLQSKELNLATRVGAKYFEKDLSKFQVHFAFS